MYEPHERDCGQSCTHECGRPVCGGTCEECHAICSCRQCFGLPDAMMVAMDYVIRFALLAMGGIFALFMIPL